MIKQSTIEKVINIVKLIRQSGLSIPAYFNSLGKSPSNFYSQINKIIKAYNGGELSGLTNVKNLLSDYESIKYRNTLIDDFDRETEEKELDIPGIQEEEKVLDTEPKVEASIVRDDKGSISGYKFKVFRKDNTPVQGILTRDEMQLIYRLYSYYGASITQREVSRYFPDYSLQDFKRILRAFNITKASGPFAPHMYEEHTEEELKEYHLREKENDFLKKIEKEELKDVKNTAIKLARENKKLKEDLNTISDIKVEVTNFTPSLVKKIDSEKSIILHLADMHIGAKCESCTLYPNDWNQDELVRRLTSITENLSTFRHFDEIILNMLGDNLDGMDNQTARRDHYMPQNMDNKEQLQVLLSTMIPFIDKLRIMCNKLTIYSVPCGNHDGDFGFAASLALQSTVNHLFPDINFILSANFIYWYKFKDHIYCICHGKDPKFMKKPLPLNLDERTKVMIYEWLESRELLNESNNGIHFIKGDLHSNALSSCNIFDYRNVLSLFGASDYSNYNFSRNAYGISYDLFIGDNRTIGTFEEL